MTQLLCMLLKLEYELFQKWSSVLLTSLTMVCIYLAMVYLHPENSEWIGSEEFSIFNALQFILIDQFLIECISVTIIFQLIRIYALRLDMTELKLSIKSIILYELKFQPILLISFFVFAPFTLTVRFLYHYFPTLDWDIYFDEYFYNSSLFLSYLIPVQIVGYTIINANLIKMYNQHLAKTKKDLGDIKNANNKKYLWATDNFGELFLDIEKIQWISRNDRKTYAVTNLDKFRLKENLSELEKKLDANKFVRVNRSTIVNMECVLNYSFWENDKYVIRMKGGEYEFIMSRDRLNKIKDRFLLGEDLTKPSEKNSY